MKIGWLKKNQRHFFVDMDPFLMLERLDIPGYFALAASKTDAAGAQELPAGLLLAVMKADRLVIEWIYVRKEFRMRGIGDGLMQAAFTVARQNGIRQVSAYVNEEWGRELVCPNEGLFLDAYGFTEKQPLAGERLTSIRELSEQLPRTNVTASRGIMVPLQQLTRTQEEDALASLCALPQAQMLYPPVKGKALLDDELSVLLKSRGEVCGGLLIQCIARTRYELIGGKLTQTKEQVLYPVYLCAETDDEAYMLFDAALQAAVKKYSKDTEVHILPELFRMQDRQSYGACAMWTRSSH